MKNLFRTTVATLALMLPASLISCGTTPEVTDVKAIILEIENELAITPTLFVGKVANSNAYVAIERRGDKVEVYICDGTATTITIATWLDGTLINGTLAATSAEDGASVTGTLTGNTISGTFKLANNSSLNFTATLSDQAPANLWQNVSNFGNPSTTEPFERLGWIVLPDGTQKGGKSPAVAVAEQINPSTGSGEEGGSNSGTLPPEIVPTNETLLETCNNIFNSDLKNQAALDGDGLTGKAKKEYITQIKIMIRFGRNQWKSQGCQKEFGDIGNPGFVANPFSNP
jgi:hypothetical protein